MRHVTFVLSAALLSIVSCGRVEGQLASSSDKVRITVLPDRTQVAGGQTLCIAVILDHEQGWHTHTNDPELPPELSMLEDAIIRTQVEASATPIVSPHVEHIQWPRGEEVLIGFGGPRVPYRVFHWRTIVYLPVIVNDDAQLGPSALSVDVTFQACDEEQCLAPATEKHTVNVRVVQPDRADDVTTRDQEIFGDFDESVWATIGYDPQRAAANSAGLNTVWVWLAGGAAALLLVGIAIVFLFRR